MWWLPFEPEVLFGCLGDDPPVDVRFGMAALDVGPQFFARLEVLATEVTAVMPFRRHTSTFGPIANGLLGAGVT
jgi:hypothetical protein